MDKCNSLSKKPKLDKEEEAEESSDEEESDDDCTYF